MQLIHDTVKPSSYGNQGGGGHIQLSALEGFTGRALII